MGYSKGTDDFQNWVWCDLKKFHLIFCMIVRQHLTPKQKEILDHKVRLCLIFCYLQWTLLLKTTTFFGIRHQSLFALMNLNMWDYIWYDIKILPWMKESLCVVVKWQMVKVFFMSPFLVNWDISPQVTFLGLQSSLLRARGDPALVCVFAKKWSHPHLACQVSHLQRDLCPILCLPPLRPWAWHIL